MFEAFNTPAFYIVIQFICIRIYHSETPHLLLYLLDQIFGETLWIESVSDELMSILIGAISVAISVSFVFKRGVTHQIMVEHACILKKSDRLRSNTRSTSISTHTFMFRRVGVQSVIELLVYMMDNRGDDDPVQLLLIDFFKNTTNYFYPDENRRTSSFSIKLTSILSSFTSNYAT
eukprot:746016_1